MKLMIVDDEPKIRNGLLKLLGAREGWQVTGVFEDALSALTALYDDEADVIVTDIKMPEVSGLELIRHQGREAAMDGKQLSREAEAGPAADGDGVGNLLVQKAIQYVEVHYGGRITLKDMSEELHLSPNYLCELFKRHTGKNLMEYVTEYRMMKARTYLNHVEYKVSDVAEMVGYKEAKYFSSTFKKIYGMTPLEYRNKR